MVVYNVHSLTATVLPRN